MSTKEEIRRAVDNQEWQIFRMRMKGKSTEQKLAMLREYYDDQITSDAYVDVCIRVDNYIKALCRGGQLYAGESLETALMARPRFGLRIKRN